MSSVADAVKKMQEKFNSSAAAGLDLVFGFRIEDGDDEAAQHFNLVVKNGTCDLQEGENDDANVTLVTDSETLKGIVKGDTDGMQAFMMGKLRTEGDMMLAMKLSELFPS